MIVLFWALFVVYFAVNLISMITIANTNKGFDRYEKELTNKEELTIGAILVFILFGFPTLFVLIRIKIRPILNYKPFGDKNE